MMFQKFKDMIVGAVEAAGVELPVDLSGISDAVGQATEGLSVPEIVQGAVGDATGKKPS